MTITLVVKEHVTQCNVVAQDEFIVSLALHMRFVDSKKNIENHQPYPLIWPEGCLSVSVKHSYT